MLTKTPLGLASEIPSSGMVMMMMMMMLMLMMLMLLMMMMLMRRRRRRRGRAMVGAMQFDNMATTAVSHNFKLHPCSSTSSSPTSSFLLSLENCLQNH